MKKAIRRLLSTLLSLIMVFSLFAVAPITAGAVGEVCRIKETNASYAAFSDALAAVKNSQTIVLTDNISEDCGITPLGGTSFTVDMSGYSIDLNTSAIIMTGGKLTFKEGDRISAKYIKVDAATLEIDANNVNARAGIIGAENAIINIDADIFSAEMHAVKADGSGSVVKINGNIDVVTEGAYENNISGIYADNGANVTLTGDISVYGEQSAHGIAAYKGSKVTVTGNISAPYGVFAWDILEGGVTVNGNIAAIFHGIQAEAGKVTVNGNLTTESTAIYGMVQSDITINGKITLVDDDDAYIALNSNVSSISLAVYSLLRDSNLSKPGYLGYTNTGDFAASTVWVRDAFIDSIDLTMPVPVAGTTMKLDHVETLTPGTAVYLDQWTKVTDTGILWGTEPYEAGKIYRCVGVIYPSNDYSFADEPIVTMNGKEVTGYNYRGSNVIDFYCDFTVAAAADEGFNVFKDVTNSDWYYDAVAYVFEKELMIGMEDDEFSPNTTLTRAMIVTILYRHAGEPDVGTLVNPFTDVLEEQWYTDAIKWAANDGVVEGYGDGKFGTADPVTKEQLAAIVYRTQKAEGKYPSDTTNNKPFGDTDKVADWATEAVNALNKQGVFFDIPGTNFNPQTPASRAGVASVLYRWLTAE